MQSFSFFFSLECPWQTSMEAVLHLKVAKMAKKMIFLSDALYVSGTFGC